jgi:diguanylate cyclase (GGDEF)-like protein/PAS domain S-box-containing protein
MKAAIGRIFAAFRTFHRGSHATLRNLPPTFELKQMEQRLELLAKVFEGSSEGLVIADAQRRVLTANASFCRSIGHDLNELVGKSPEWLLSLDPASERFDEPWIVADRSGSWHGEVYLQRRDGRTFPASLVVDAVLSDAGHLSHYVWATQDITEKRVNEQRIQFLAHHDPLTRLPNRQLFSDRLRMAMQLSKQHGTKIAVLVIDLDRFKSINESLGHHVGDALLRSVSLRLFEAVRNCDLACRLGSDEFVFALTEVTSADEALATIEHRLLPLIRGPHVVGASELHISCSIGISMYPDDAVDTQDCIRHAELAMHEAKTMGRDGFQFFTKELNERAHSRSRLELHLHNAMERGEFSLHYQPRINSRTNELMGVEALLRWNSSELGLVLPTEFIPIAEELGLIGQIGAWVVEQACQQQAKWLLAGHGLVPIAINISAVQLDDQVLQQTLVRSMQTWSTEPSSIELELTESALMRDVNSALYQLQALKGLGVMLSIDDFGTGYSSLSYLRQFPIDRLKIDRSFVARMLDDPADLAIAQAIIGLGHTLGLQIVAEGVESETVAAALRLSECDELQGFLFSEAITAERLTEWLAGWRALQLRTQRTSSE